MFTALSGRRAADALSVALWRGLIAIALLGLCALFAALTSPAHAQTTPTSTVFDFGPWASALLEFLAPTVLAVVTLLGTWILKRLGSWLGLQIDDTQRAALNQALDRAVSFAFEKLADQAKGGIPIDLKHDAIVTAAGYAQRSVPDALKHFGVSDRRLAEMVESRLQGMIVAAAAVPDAEPVSPIFRTATA